MVPCLCVPGLFLGRLFGTTEEGGTHNMGTVFQVRLPGELSGNAKERVLYSFGSVAGDGMVPMPACCLRSRVLRGDS